MSQQQLPEISIEDIQTDYWLVIDSKIVDFSEFIWKHPGGPSYLKEYLHKDATEKFHYFGHSERAMEMVNEMAIGVLKKDA